MKGIIRYAMTALIAVIVMALVIISLPKASAVDSDLNSGLLWEGNFSECGPGDINATIGNITHYGGGVVCGNDGYGDYIDMDEVDNPNYNRLDNLTIGKVLANYTMTWVIWAEMGADISNERHVLVGAETVAPNTQRADIFRFDTRPVVEAYTSFTQYNNGSGNINWQGIAPFNASTFRGHGVNRLVLMLNGTHLFMIVNNTIINSTQRPANQPGNMSSNEPFYLGDRQFAFSEFYDGRVWQMAVWDHNLSCNPDMSVNNVCLPGSDLAYLWNDFPTNQTIPQYPYPAPPVPIADFNITTCQQLQDMENDTSANYYIINDIYCGNVPFEPISSFTGKLYGNHHTIYDLNISASGVSKGLFSSLQGTSTVSNLTIERCSVLGPGDSHGCLAGVTGGNITNCFASEIQVSGTNYVGGLLGRVQAAVMINISVSSFDVTASASRSGGLLGSMENSILLSSCSEGGYTESPAISGGLYGENINSDVNDTFTTGVYVNCSSSGGTFGGSHSSNPMINRSWTDNTVDGGATCWSAGLASYHDQCYVDSDVCVTGKCAPLSTFQMTIKDNFNLSFGDVWHINPYIEPPRLVYKYANITDILPPECGIGDGLIDEGEPYIFNATCTDDSFIKDFNITCAELENGNLMLSYNRTGINSSSFVFVNMTLPLYNITVCSIRSVDWHQNLYQKDISIFIRPEPRLKTNVCPDTFEDILLLYLALAVAAVLMMFGSGTFGVRVPIIGVFGALMLMWSGFTFVACSFMLGMIMIVASVPMIIWFFLVPKM